MVKEKTPIENEPIKKEKQDKKNPKKKKTLVELVEKNSKKYNTDVIASTLILENLFNIYEEDYENSVKGLEVPVRLTQDEFDKIIKENLNRKI